MHEDKSFFCSQSLCVLDSINVKFNFSSVATSKNKKSYFDETDNNKSYYLDF